MQPSGWDSLPHLLPRQGPQYLPGRERPPAFTYPRSMLQKSISGKHSQEVCASLSELSPYSGAEAPLQRCRLGIPGPNYLHPVFIKDRVSTQEKAKKIRSYCFCPVSGHMTGCQSRRNRVLLRPQVPEEWHRGSYWSRGIPYEWKTLRLSLRGQILFRKVINLNIKAL